MKSTLLLPLLALALVLGAWSGCAPAAPPDQVENLALTSVSVAADVKPLLVVSLAGYDKIMADIGYVGKLAERPKLGKGLEGIMEGFLKGTGLDGLDKSRPWGAVVMWEGGEPSGFAFVPVKNLKDLLAALEPFVGAPKDRGEGLLELKGGQKPVYLKQQGGWAYIADKPESLVQVPSDPVTLLGGLEKQYDVAVRFHATNVPDYFREQILFGIKGSAQRDLQQRPGESDSDFAIRKQVSEEMLRSVTTLAEDLDTLTLGWALDPKNEKTYLELAIAAKPGSATARQAGEVKEMKSQFAGFELPGAAVTGNWVGKIPEARIASLSAAVAAFRSQALKDIDKGQGTKSDEEIKLSKELMSDLTGVLEKTIKSGKIDGGLAVLLKPEAATLLAGGYVADAATLDKAAKTAAGVLNPVIGDWIKLDAEEFKSIRFHLVSIPVPFDIDNRDAIVKLVGEKLEIALGIGKDSAYVAAGRDALKGLKEAIEKSAAEGGKSVPPAHFAVAVGPVAKFLSTVGDEKARPKAAMVAEMLSKSPQTDHVQLLVHPIPNGVKYRLEVEQGLLQLVGRLVASASGAK